MKKHRHIGVYGIIINNNQILLIKKSRGAYTGKLDLPGGSFEHGETPIETIKREIKEETDLDIKSLKLFDVNAVNIKWQNEDDIEDLHHIGMFYTINCEESKLKTESDGEDSLGADWYEIERLSKNNISPFTAIVLESLGYKIK